MAKIGDFYWEITADTSKADKSLKSSETQVEKLGKSSTSAGKLIKAAFSVAAVAGVAAFSKKIVSAALEAEKAYQVQESAITALNAALSATGQYSDEASADIQAYASELQGLTTVGDESSIALSQYAINAGLSTEASKQATKDAIALSKAFGVDLNAAIKATVNAQQGNYDMLNRYIPSVKNASDETEKAAEAEKALAAAFEVATAETQTSLGVQTQLQNALGDSKEIAGRYVAEALKPWRAALLEIVTEINNTKAAQDNLNSVLAGTGGSIQQAFDEQSKKVDEYRNALSLSGAELTKFLRHNRLTVRSLESAVEAEEAILNTLQAKLSIQRISNSVEKEAAQRAVDLAEAEQARKKELSDYLKLVDTEYAQTQQGKLESLEKEIELWEEYQKTAVNTAPQVQAILEELREQYAALTETEEEGLDAMQQRVVDKIHLEELTLQAVEGRAEKERRIAEETAAFEEEMLLQRTAAYASLFGSVSELISAFGSEAVGLAVAQKAFASAEAAINSYLAFTQVLADPTLGAFTKPIMAASVLASGLAQQVKILSTPIPSFETGGIVPGNSYTGDNVQANVNSAEMILTQAQQAKLFDLANGGSSSGGNMTVYLKLPDNTSVKWVVDGINSGKAGVIQGRVVK